MAHAVDQPPFVTIAAFDRFLEDQRGDARYEIDTGWETETLTGPEAVLRFETVGFEMSVSEIYAGVEIADIVLLVEQ